MEDILARGKLKNALEVGNEVFLKKLVELLKDLALCGSGLVLALQPVTDVGVLEQAAHDSSVRLLDKFTDLIG